MAVQRNFYQECQSLRRGRVTLFGKVVLGAGGAISTNVDRRSAGFTVTKTATKTGRYTLTFDDVGYHFLGMSVNIVGPDDAAMTDAKGVFLGVVRDDDLATDGTIEFQMQDADSMADAEVQDSATLYIVVNLSRLPTL